MAEEQLEIKKDQEYAIRPQTTEEKQQILDDDLPSYQIDLDLDDAQEEDLNDQVFLEFESLKQERIDLKLEDKWKTADRQYDGELKENKLLSFNLHMFESKIKADAITRAISEAFLDSNPIFDVTPRPEQARDNGYDIAEKQSQFLDFAMDEEINIEDSLVKIAQSAVKKFVGIGKLTWRFKKERRRREESYDGSDIKPLGVDQEGNPIAENVGLKKFKETYPDAVERYPGYVKRLRAGKKIDIVVEFKDTVYNNPKIEYVKIEDFYVRNACNCNEGLREEHFIAERQSFSYWELEAKKESGEFKNVEKLYDSENDSTAPTGKSGDYMVKDYDVLEVTTFYKNKDSDEPKRIKAWFGEEKKVFLAAQEYPYYGFDIDYLAFYLTKNDYGFYGDARSVIFDLRDLDIAQDALLNLTLHGLLIRNTVTPIVQEGSAIEDMFLDHKFTSGKPLSVDPLTDDVRKAVDFVTYPNMDINGSLAMGEKIKRIGSDLSKVSDLTTGGESALDPNAPAAKTIALLEQSGIGVKDYLRNFLPTFNELAGMLLQLYHQMSNEDKQFRVVGKSKAVTGDNPFSEITRDEMVVKTNIQSRAAAFAFDKANEKREAMAAYQTVNQDPYASQQPKIRYKALKVLLDTFGDRWKTISDTDLASPEEFEQQMEIVAMKAIQMLMQQAQQKGANTGVAPNPRETLSKAPQVAAQAQAVAFDPSLAEEKS